MTNNNVNGLDIYESGRQLSKKAVGGELVGAGHIALADEVILHLGVYDKISIEGGQVYFIPGIYVMASQFQNQDVLKITGGVANFEGSMFYVTGDNYDPLTGWPDTTDGENPPPAPDGAKLGRVTINAEMTFTPIDTSTRTPTARTTPGAKPCRTSMMACCFFNAGGMQSGRRSWAILRLGICRARSTPNGPTSKSPGRVPTTPSSSWAASVLPARVT